ncbi:hypothetical protein RSJ42_09930 [Methanosarcina hadiensis]|uniref:hypothetical protein n=1 Tax=Methanosarcina hadiensis TaxID=3078083 RepID=UPI003977686B
MTFEGAVCSVPCGHSQKKPFCDGTHTEIHFDGTEAGDYKPYREGAKVISGPVLTLTDNRHFCVHAEFCLRAGGIGSLLLNPITQSQGYRY